MPRALCNDVLGAGCVPHAWHTTWFLVLAKSQKAKKPIAFRPIASIHLLYQVFVYMILSRVENVLDTMRPKEQHRFRHYCEHCH